MRPLGLISMACNRWRDLPCNETTRRGCPCRLTAFASATAWLNKIVTGQEIWRELHTDERHQQIVRVM